MVVITVECFDKEPHEPHSWREGFLWHRKRVCGGVPAWLKPFPKESQVPNYAEADAILTQALYESLPKHRHHFGFCPEKSDSVYMVWECLDPFCAEEVTEFRMFFRLQTLNRKGMSDGRTVTFKKYKI